MRRTVVALALTFAAGCSPELSVDELVAALEREGISVAARKDAGSTIQHRFSQSA